MPSYPWLATKNTDFMRLRKKTSVLKYLGVPYTDEQVANADVLAEEQAREVAQTLRDQGVTGDNLEQKEIVALIAYLQSLGQKTTDLMADSDTGESEEGEPEPEEEAGEAGAEGGER